MNNEPAFQIVRKSQLNFEFVGDGGRLAELVKFEEVSKWDFTPVQRLEDQMADYLASCTGFVEIIPFEAGTEVRFDNAEMADDFADNFVWGV